MPWQPMSRESAERVLESFAAAGGTDAHGFARLIEAWLVTNGAQPDRVKTAVEAILGHPVADTLSIPRRLRAGW
jgi:hypothetical protein